MLEDGVATAEDIDRAMVVAYRHPIGPLRLSDIVGLDVILVDEDSSSPDPSLDGQANKLIKSFCQIVLGRKGGLSVLRDRIAPTGWAVVVAILLQVAPLRGGANRLRPRLWPMDATKIGEAEAALRTLVAFFASPFESGGPDDGWPWDAFRRLNDNKPKNPQPAQRMVSGNVLMAVIAEAT